MEKAVRALIALRKLEPHLFGVLDNLLNAYDSGDELEKRAIEDTIADMLKLNPPTSRREQKLNPPMTRRERRELRLWDSQSQEESNGKTSDVV